MHNGSHSTIHDFDDNSADDWSVSDNSDDSQSSTEDNFTMQQFNNCKHDNPMSDLQNMQVLVWVHHIRSRLWQHRRLDWNAHVAQLMHEGVFDCQSVLINY
eukprot:CCRYP_018265-RA/>CCRYP_018265-RA protein AED:0.16 eAED:0.16 QI:66/1/1/1/0/0/2/1/100